MIRVFFSILGQMFLGIEPSAYCESCGKRRPVAHFDVEHGRQGGYWS